MSTTWPPAAPPPAPRPRRLARAAGVLVALVALVSSVSLTALTERALRDPGAGAGDFLGADGQVSWMASNGQFETVETQLAIGTQPLTSSYPAFLAAPLDLPTVLKTTWVVERRGPEGALITTLMRVNDQGVSTLGSSNGGDSVLYDPARIDIPAHPVAGLTWKQNGKVVTESTTSTYSVEGSVVAGSSAGCLRFKITETWADKSEHNTEVERCRGRGIVADVARGLTPINNRPDPIIDFTTKTRPSSELAPQGTGSAPVFWGRPPTYQLRIPPRVVTGGIAWVDSLTNNVFVGAQAKGSLVALWERHPGGHVQAMNAFGEVIVTGSTLRRLTAYTVTGERIWSVDSTDVVNKIERLDNNRAVTLSDTGLMSAYDLRTGERVWSREVGNGPQSALVVEQGRVAVAVGRAVVVVEGATGEVIQTRTGSEVIDWVGVVDGELIAEVDGRLTRFDQNGQVRWQRPTATLRDFQRVDKTTAVLRRGSIPTLLNLETGQLTELPLSADTSVPALIEGKPTVMTFGLKGMRAFSTTGAQVHADPSAFFSAVASRATPWDQPGAVVAWDGSKFWLWGKP